MAGLPSLADLLEVAIAAARAGGARALARFGKPLAVERKPDGSEVTLADREGEAVIRDALLTRFPAHGFLGEETGERAGSLPVRWIVDPIDGTQTFVRGVPLWGVLVAAEVEGDPAVGVIDLPALGETVAAARGLGCTWNGSRCRVSETDALSRALVVVASERAMRERGPGWDRLVRATALQRTWADCYGYALVATGRAEVAVDPRMKVWDSAALIPVIEEAGGRITGWDGRRDAASPDQVASNGRLHAAVLGLLS